jgi:L-lactate dehydrogenase complex protein LldG
MSEAKADILARVRQAQYADQTPDRIEEELLALGAAPPAPLDCPDTVETFFVRLIKNQVSCDIVHSRPDAVKSISDFLYREHNSRRAVAGNDARLAALPWRDGGVLVRFGAAGPDDPVSISHAKLAIAESGSMVLFSNRENPAVNNWLVRDHLVVVDARDLVATFEDAWTRIRGAWSGDHTPRGITFVSGPSSTGDIVGHLVKGAHGPQRLHVIYIGRVEDDLQERARQAAALSKA